MIYGACQKIQQTLKFSYARLIARCHRRQWLMLVFPPRKAATNAKPRREPPPLPSQIKPTRETTSCHQLSLEQVLSRGGKNRPNSNGSHGSPLGSAGPSMPSTSPSSCY